MKVIAIAGTKGKTTTTNMIAKVMEAGGYKVAMLSTANFQIGKTKWLNNVKLTTPSPFYLHNFLKKASKEKCDYAIIEVSSHGLVQYRHYGIKYQTVVLTNMMSDHLDYHRTYENYKNSHDALITKDLKNLIINYDDEDLRSFLSDTKANRYVFSLKGYSEIPDANLVRASEIVFSKTGSGFTIIFNREDKRSVNIPLIGEFNIYNSLAAFCAGLAEGISPDNIKSGLESVKEVPGRLEKIAEGQNFDVIVDYAHSPDSLKSVYSAVKPYVRNRLIAVLGGTGDRDASYRAKAGKLADEYADVVIVTNEDPYSEDPEKIMDQVLSGIRNKKAGKDLFRIYDRSEAIERAIKMAAMGDMVIITGKGAEQFMVVGDKKIPWDDRVIARNALKADKI
jgi:UDP-N-acetylmuramyl-tripeptide synthetase